MRNFKRQSLILSASSSPLQAEEPRFASNSGNRTSSAGVGSECMYGGSRHSFMKINPNDSRVVSLDSLTNCSNIKLLLIGDAGVGKTAMILSYCNELPRRDGMKQEVDTKSWQARVKSIQKKKRYSFNDFEGVLAGDDSDYMINTSSTIGIDIKTNLVDIDNRLFKVIMWDTAGQERYRNAMISSLYKGSNAIILSYDICDFNSFQNCLEYWFVESIRNIPELFKTRFYLVGNKLDLYGERKVLHEDVLLYISKLEEEYGVKIAGNFEVSCKWENVVERTFNIIIKDLVESGCYEDDGELHVEESLSNEESGDSLISQSTMGSGVRRRKPYIDSRTIDLTQPTSGRMEAGSHSSKGSTCCA